jgi:hypothetical protein
MKLNVGTTDRTIRILAGIAAICAGYYFGNWWGGIGLVLIITGLMRSCPAYSLMKISTASKL